MIGFVVGNFTLIQGDVTAVRGRRSVCRQGGLVCKASQALIFDCDGVILESESLHRDAYNQVFREFDVEYEWTPEYYDELQNKVGGGKPKMRYYFRTYGWPASKLGPSPSSSDAETFLIDQLQDRKTEIYQEYIAGGVASLRPGVARFMDDAIAARSDGLLKLAICSAATKSSVWYVLNNLVGEERLSNFDVILAGDDVPKKKPDPTIYNVASERMNVSPSNCVVIEDSLIGLQAALAAGMECVITYTDSTKDQKFEGARKIFPELGNSEETGVSLLDIFPQLNN
ncbi:hypothetical protein NDN08_004124 [Rhodosorus marinus]|uniref:Uncharacterized protein n=1 Tax=Rhodosorus marinus TaxID=101924 RepID=A0AAV8UHC7_9RHOD|nr:hypothetical protein NDN08_004124 [Rhodosorus marinus]